MLVIQHIWSRWDKATRGANAPYQRPRLAPAYSLPPADGRADVLLHDIGADMISEVDVVETIGTITRDAWQRRDTVLGWHAHPDHIDIILSNPSPYRLQTRWPEHLPSPLFTLRRGDTARIEWNGRFRMSLFGSNRASYYAQHVYWLAFADEPSDRLFLDAEPRKQIDLTCQIY